MVLPWRPSRDRLAVCSLICWQTIRIGLHDLSGFVPMGAGTRMGPMAEEQVGIWASLTPFRGPSVLRRLYFLPRGFDEPKDAFMSKNSLAWLVRGRFPCEFPFHIVKAVKSALASGSPFILCHMRRPIPEPHTVLQCTSSPSG